ncbi:hypothetical protein [Streptomyces sp. AB3(2024)]|uniref:hypothetical protein n=1 Tax=Streptomyces sp. AB3(2024) TaxID=3317321 RepID=UPI0035A271F5
MFTGFGQWTGLQVGELNAKLPEPFTRLDAPDVVWGLPIAVVLAVLQHSAMAAGRDPQDVASSGESTLATLTADPQAWAMGALIAVLLCRAVGYALCLGSLRGSPVFPALFLGAARGLLLSPLPGLGVVPGWRRVSRRPRPSCCGCRSAVRRR